MSAGETEGDRCDEDNEFLTLMALRDQQCEERMMNGGMIDRLRAEKAAAEAGFASEEADGAAVAEAWAKTAAWSEILRKCQDLSLLRSMSDRVSEVDSVPGHRQRLDRARGDLTSFSAQFGLTRPREAPGWLGGGEHHPLWFKGAIEALEKIIAQVEGGA